MTFTPEQLAVVVAGVFGACVGSFLNVVIYRLPAGKSVVTPPSSCPHCGHRLRFFENVPVFAWLALRGKCRKCRTPISAQYPLIEALTGLLFAGLVAVYYFTPLRSVFAGVGVVATWPVLVVHLVLLAVMIAATMIDARHYIIPIQLPWLVAVTALIVPPVALLTGQLDAYDLNPGPYLETLVPILPPIDLPGFNFYLSPAQQLAASLATVVGLLISNALLRFKVLPRSFDDGELPGDTPHEADAPLNTDPNAPDSFLHHPHPRREIGKELLFLGPAVVFAVAAALLTPTLVGDPALPAWLHTIGGATLGGLIGGAVVWAIRIFGTLLFGKEAMGLGDVHLMVGVGAVVGWADVTLAFFLAPFFGIAGAIAVAGLSVLTKGRKRAIPFGPYLCAATLLVMVFRTPLFAWLVP